MLKRFVKGLLGLTLVASIAAPAARAEVKMQGAGATFPAPIYQRWVAEYQKAHPDVKIDYQAIGSGGGIKGITEKTVDFGASDAPMSAKELKAAGDDVVQIPTVAGAVVIAYNLPGLSQQLKLDGPTIADIFLGKVKNWNDPRIAALNAGLTLPATAITPVHRTDGSGTNYIFTNYLATQSEEFKEKVGTGKSVEWPGGQGGKGSDGVTQIVQGTQGALAYVEIAYAHQNKITYALLKNKDGQFVDATAETVSAAGEGALAQMDKGLAVNIWNQAGAKAYPIASFTYILVHKDLSYVKDAAKAKALVDFLKWSTGEGQRLAAELDYAPLSAGVQKKVAEAIATLTWAGQPVAMK
jgi:phosphate transport system substrate-binding protein